MGVEENIEQEFNWYVVKIISGQEKKIKSYLEHEIVRLRYEELVKQVLVPAERVYEMRSGKRRVKERSYLPGYVILHANLRDPEVAHALSQVPGVIGFLGSTEKQNRIPIPLRKQEVNRLLGKIDENNGDALPLTRVFHTGEEVKVIDGPFSGFTGAVEEVHEEKKKLRVMVKIFGRNTPLELNFYQVEKLGID